MGGPIQQQQLNQAVQATTNAPATGATLTGGVLGWLLGNQGEILFILSASLILCQLFAFGYRFFNWIKNRNLEPTEEG